MTESQRDTAAAKTVVVKRRYDPTAMIGLIIAVAPDLIQELTNSDLGFTQQWVSIIRIVGLFVAAYGRSLLFRKPALQDGDVIATEVIVK